LQVNARDCSEGQSLFSPELPLRRGDYNLSPGWVVAGAETVVNGKKPSKCDDPGNNNYGQT